MNKNAKKVIIDAVSSVGGCKATELAAMRDVALLNINLTDTIEELVKEGKLIEVEYILPQMTYRIKSFLLPMGSEVRYELKPFSEGK